MDVIKRGAELYFKLLCSFFFAVRLEHSRLKVKNKVGASVLDRMIMTPMVQSPRYSAAFLMQAKML